MEAPAAGMDFGHSDLRPSWCAMTPWTRSRENIHSLTHLGGELKTRWQREQRKEEYWSHRRRLRRTPGLTFLVHEFNSPNWIDLTH
jgi:hypothetical protein